MNEAQTEAPEAAGRAEPPDLTAAEKERGMHFVLYGAALGIVYFFAVDGSVFTLFATRLGASNTNIGNLTSLLQITALLQVFMAGLMERYGKKRFIVPGWTVATLFTIPYIAVPWVAQHYSRTAAIYFLMCAVIPVSLARQVGNAGWMPLLNDVTPAEVRGRFFGKMRTIWQIVSVAFLLFTVVFFMGSDSPAFWRYQVIFIVGIAASILRIATIMKIPEPPPAPRQKTASIWQTINMPFRDSVYVRFTIYSIVLTTALAVSDTYQVVYLKKGMGYNDSRALFASTTTGYVGSAASLLLWGMLADRVGAKPLMVITTLAMGLVRFLWLAADAGPAGQVVVQTIFLLNGVFAAGWGIANTKYLFGICPRREGKTTYVVIAGVTTTIVSSIMVSLGGYIIDGTAVFRPELARYGLNEYTLQFLVTGVLVLLSMPFLTRMLERGTVPTREVLAALVSRPIRTSYNVFLFSRMLPEDRRIDVTRALGDMKSVIGEEELLRALDDPSIQVRREAADALGRMKSRRAVKTLSLKVADPHSFVRVSAAAALGEIASAAAVPALAAVLGDANAELRLQAALALGRIGSPEAIAPLKAALALEKEETVWSVAATALAMLGDASILPDAVSRIRPDAPQPLRSQLLLAIANAVGAEDELYQYLHVGESRFADSAREVMERMRGILRFRPMDSPFDAPWGVVDIDDGRLDGDYAAIVRGAHSVAHELHPRDASSPSTPARTVIDLLTHKAVPSRWDTALLALVTLESIAFEFRHDISRE